jgi:arylsulfatase
MPRKMEADIQRRLEASGGTDPLVAKTVQIAQNMEPVIPHDDQAAVARKKQADLEKKTGKKPNILIFLMDEWAGAIQAAMAAASWPARPHRTWTAWPQRG